MQPLLRIVWPLALLLPACRSAAPPPADAVGHAVVFELTDPARASVLAAELRTLLAETPGLLEGSAGTRADVAVREGVTDTRFDVLLWTHFESVAAFRTYLEAPAHVQLVERFTPELADVRVYDAWTGRE